MAVSKIITAENPLLRHKSKKVTRFGDSLHRLINDLYDTLENAEGLGLAAPQIGILERVFVIILPTEYDDKGKVIAPQERYTLINPQFIRMRGEAEMIEGCLSVPGYQGKVKRAVEVTIKGQDLHGKPVRYRAEGLLAHVLQHEYDHLDGMLYLDRLESPDNLWAVQPQEAEEAETQGRAI
ncbi:MAG: peptide deformylase [Chloroflexi bacterium]|nr:peptide deformylase [Chloroflexota bacterium]